MTIKNDLLHWWDMNEGSGSTVVDQHGTNDGTITGASWVSDGSFGDVLDFGGKTDNHRVTTGGVTFGNEVSIGVWVRKTVLEGGATFLGWSGSVSDKPHCYTTDDDGENLQIFRAGSNLFKTSDEPTPEQNIWYFVVYTRDGTGNTHKIFVNGVESTLEEVSSLTENWGTQSENMLLGARTDSGGGTPQNSQNWAGQLTRAFVYERAITQSEVNFLYNGGDGRTYSQLEEDSPELDTQAADNITDTGARLNAEITDLGGETSVDAYFQYREQGSGTWIDTTPKQELTAIGTYNETISGLTASTEYEFRAAVEWDSGAEETFGDTLTFTTLEAPEYAFTVTLPAASAQEGKKLVIKDETGELSSNAVLLEAGTGDTIDGSSEIVLDVSRMSIAVISDGVDEWHII